MSVNAEILLKKIKKIRKNWEKDTEIKRFVRLENLGQHLIKSKLPTNIRKKIARALVESLKNKNTEWYKKLALKEIEIRLRFFLTFWKKTN